MSLSHKIVIWSKNVMTNFRTSKNVFGCLLDDKKNSNSELNYNYRLKSCIFFVNTATYSLLCMGSRVYVVAAFAGVQYTHMQMNSASQFFHSAVLRMRESIDFFRFFLTERKFSVPFSGIVQTVCVRKDFLAEGKS